MTAKLSKNNDWKYTFTQLPVMVPTGEDFKGAYEAAEYRILETEMNGKLPEQNIDGAKYKETTYDVTKASAVSPMKVTITNVYVPDTEVSLEAVKIFENGKLNKKNVFKFDVSEETVSATGEKTLKHVADAATKDGISNKNGSKGKVYFEPVKYSLDDLKRDDGTYEQQKIFRYVIRERIPSGADKNGFDKKSNIKYDTETLPYSPIQRIRRHRQRLRQKQAIIPISCCLRCLCFCLLLFLQEIANGNKIEKNIMRSAKMRAAKYKEKEGIYHEIRSFAERYDRGYEGP